MDHGIYRATRVFGSLNGLRCLSILAVVWHHAAGQDVRLPLLRSGHMGVTLFFVISGFLITTLLLRERDSCGDISLPAFYARRTLRIFPLYYTVILLYLALVLVVEPNSSEGQAFLHHNLPHFLTYTSNWFVRLDDSRVIFYFAWSLAAEEQFYLIWPSVERFLRGRWPMAVAVALVAVPLFAGTAAGLRVFGTDGPAHVVLTNVPAGICLGVLLAHLLHGERGYRWVSAILGWRLASPVLLAAVVAGLAGMEAAGYWGGFGVTVLMALLVGSCVVREDHALAPVLKFRPVAWIGMISYGMYLLHMLAINAAEKPLHRLGWDTPLPRFVFGTVLVVAAASASYVWYESFFLRLKQRFARRPVSLDVEATAAVAPTVAPTAAPAPAPAEAAGEVA